MIGGGAFNLPQNMAQGAGLAAVVIAWVVTLAGFEMAWGYWLSAAFGNVAFAVLFMQTVGYFFPIFKSGNNWPSIAETEGMIGYMIELELRNWMGPKVEAAGEFASRTGRRAVIGALDDIERLVAGTAGTSITLDQVGQDPL